MNKRQKIVLLVAIVLFMLAGLFPNHESTNWWDGNRYRYAYKRRFLLYPPRRSIDHRRMLLEWTLIALPSIGLFFFFKDKKNSKEEDE